MWLLCLSPFLDTNYYPICSKKWNQTKAISLNPNPYGLFSSYHIWGGGCFPPPLKTALDSPEFSITWHSYRASNLQHVAQFGCGCHALWRHSDVIKLKIGQNQVLKLNLSLTKILKELYAVFGLVCQNTCWKMLFYCK